MKLNCFFSKSIFFIFCFVCNTLFFSAQEYNINYYSTEDGLAGSEVYSALQDEKGQLWIGTYGGGISRYDGINFYNYTTRNGLTDNRVLCIFQDSKQNIWIGTYGGGVSMFDGKKFSNYTTQQGLANDIVYSIKEDNNNKIWFGTFGGGVSVFDGKNFKSITDKEGLCGNNTWALLKDTKGNMWVGTDGGANCIDTKGNIISYKKENGLTYGMIWSLLEDKKGNIWMGTYGGGVFKFDGKSFVHFSTKEGLNNTIIYSLSEDSNGNIWMGSDAGGVNIFNGKTFSYITEKNGLAHNRVRCIFRDREGITWIGTDGGMNKYSGKNFTRYSVKEGLSDNKVLSILKTGDGNFWMGTFGGGLNEIRFSEENPEEIKEIKKFNSKNGLAGDRIWKIFEDSKKNIWIGTTNGISVYNGKIVKNYSIENGLPSNSIYAIFEDKSGNIWIGHDQGVSIFNGKTFTNYGVNDGLSHNRVRSIAQDVNGNIWLGTYAGGVTKYDGKIFSAFAEEKKLEKITVYCLLTDKKGKIWFGTYGHGIVCFDPSIAQGKKERFDYFSMDDGLSSDAVLLMNIDNNGTLWVGTSIGVDAIDMNAYSENGKKIIKRYGKTEGFRGIQCHQNAVFTDEKNNTWFGTINGAIKFSASGDSFPSVEAKTNITSVQLFYGEKKVEMYADSTDRKTGLPVNLKLPYNQNNLTFNFTGISLLDPFLTEYKFTLENFDKGWTPTTKETKATYSNIPPGNYSFKVIACNDKGLWNKNAAVFSFTVQQPYWQRWWFRLLFSSAGAFFIWLFLKVRTKKIIHDNLELDKKVKEQTKELIKKNSENELLLKEIHHRVKNNLQLVSSLLSLQESTITDEKVMSAIKECQNRVNSMAMIHRKLYLTEKFSEIEFQNYTEQLITIISESYSNPNKEIKFSVSANQMNFNLDTAIPLGLILNELVTNSFKYAFKEKENGSIKITFEKTGDSKHRLIYSDDGIGLPDGFDPETTTTLGMMLIFLLSEQIGGNLKYESEKGKGAKFIIEF